MFRGPAFEALNLVAVDDNRCGDRSATRFLAVVGMTYYFAVDGVCVSRRALQGESPTSAISASISASCPSALVCLLASTATVISRSGM